MIKGFLVRYAHLWRQTEMRWRLFDVQWTTAKSWLTGFATYLSCPTYCCVRRKEYICMAHHRRQDADAERTGMYLQRVGHTDVFFSSASLLTSKPAGHELMGRV